MQTCMDKKWKKNHQSWKSVNLYRWTIYLNLFEYLWNANTTKNIAKFDQEKKEEKKNKQEKEINKW